MNGNSFVNVEFLKLSGLSSLTAQLFNFKAINHARALQIRPRFVSGGRLKPNREDVSLFALALRA